MKNENIALLMILIAMILFILGFFMIGTGISNICQDNDLKLSWNDLNCYKEVDGGIIKYQVEDVGFFQYKLNVQPIVPN
jgi:hypothetical protein